MSALAVISLVFYTGYAMMVRGFPFNMVDFGRSLGIVFAGVGFGSIGHGLQARDAASIPPTPEETPPTNTVTFFDRLCDANDSSAEMHLFLGALGIIGLIVSSDTILLILRMILTRPIMVKPSPSPL
ncbi:unnamed protein product [Sphagnum jensenii]|uniref:Uncharacterized protein n=1 Tax=Sphagnum jensenii TaxID=128206 RepID=A0ABP0VK51_9BRYO